MESFLIIVNSIGSEHVEGFLIIVKSIGSESVSSLDMASEARVNGLEI